MINIKECRLFRKICTKCKKVKNIREFRKDKYSKTGYTCRCKMCIDNKYKNECEYCGREFLGSHKSQKFCSISCSNTYKNKLNTKYNVAKEIKDNGYDIDIVDAQLIRFSCYYCGNDSVREFSKYRLTKYHYCSIECKCSHKEIYEGENSATWTGGSEKVSCSYCDKDMYITKYYNDKFKNHYCSTECMGKHRETLYVGENSPTWNPDLTDEEREDERNYVEYKQWRKDVYRRDRYICDICGTKGGNINAHHLNSYRIDKENRTNIDNGITLCEECHKNFHKEYGYFNNTKDQYMEYKISLDN